MLCLSDFELHSRWVPLLIPAPPIFHGKISGGEAEKKEKKKKIPLDFTKQDGINLNLLLFLRFP